MATSKKPWSSVNPEHILFQTQARRRTKFPILGPGPPPTKNPHGAITGFTSRVRSPIAGADAVMVQHPNSASCCLVSHARLRNVSGSSADKPDKLFFLSEELVIHLLEQRNLGLQPHTLIHLLEKGNLGLQPHAMLLALVNVGEQPVAQPGKATRTNQRGQ
eukprot:CAMPEP_0204165762 /NCGR_PEP_ID=MMETSP0361-20130328/38436_1 /ASSEMBLY_ACC=CAM_ASM_000343 /TAXON_ID=268821 /ORGANISM="Scrippsiella Hangoei, Strain SHTV-5" /LENGTH=160 /DNA_ID=CAMNT_0051122809 /DNA_START=83 /DNA_END=564 /DNA_ORIENTATION=+